jgi:hypothetical protein
MAAVWTFLTNQTRVLPLRPGMRAVRRKPLPVWFLGRDS